MKTTVETHSALTSLFVEVLLNNTDKLSKVSPHSATMGISTGVGAIGQLALKDIALIESKLLPIYGSGSVLDEIAPLYGISSRLTATNSSTFLRIVGVPGTQYLISNQVFTGSHGLLFELDSNFTIPTIGWGYAKVHSVTSGLNTNIPALQINTIINAPVGHKYVVNEYAATGGRDLEDDESFVQRILSRNNIHSQGTLGFLQEICRQSNPNVSQVFFGGLSVDNTHIIYISTINGVDLSVNELKALANYVQPFLNLSDLRTVLDDTLAIEFRNTEYFPIDFDFRASFVDDSIIDDTRKEIQINLSKSVRPVIVNKYKIEWDDLLQTIKDTKNVLYVPDTTFNPSVDIVIEGLKVPRIRGFILRDLSGNVLIDFQNILNPIYYG